MSEKIEIKKDKGLLKEIALSIFKSNSGFSDSSFGIEQVETMLKNEDIAIAVKALSRAVVGREIRITSEDGDSQEKILEIQKRFNKIKKFNFFIENVINARYYGFSVHEIIYNDDFTFKKLEFIPQEKIDFDKDKSLWYIKGDDKFFIENPTKFIISTYDDSMKYIKGKSVLEPIYNKYNDLKNINTITKEIVEKYGEIIPVFAYETGQDEATVRKQAEQIKELKGKNVLAIPLSEGNLKDNFYFISLHDLQIEMHIQLMEKWEKKVKQYILGGNLTLDDGGGTGSYALGEVHQSEKEKIEEEIINFVRDELYKLIEIDANFFGYEAENFYFAFEKERDLKSENELKKAEEETKKIKVEKFSLLNQAGYKISKKHLAQELGIPESELEEIEIKTFNSDKEFQKKKSKISIFNKKEEDFFKISEEVIKKILENISSDIEKQIKNIKEIEDLEKISFENERLKDILCISECFGMLNTKINSEFADDDEIDPFNLKFEEAINYFKNKEPELFKNIDLSIKDNINKYFWIKKTTDKEISIKLFNNLNKNLDEGLTFKDFLNNVKDTGINDKAYLENVLRTNIQSAYAAGHYKAQVEDDDNPNWLYNAIDDGRTSPICKKLDGKVFHKDDSIWNDIYPPNHFQCRSNVIALNDEDLDDEGLELSNSKDFLNSNEYKDFSKTSFANSPNKWYNTIKNIDEKKDIKIKDLKEKVNDKISKMANDKIKDIVPISFPEIKKSFGEEIYNKFKNIAKSGFFKSPKYGKTQIKYFEDKIDLAYKYLNSIKGTEKILGNNKLTILNGIKVKGAVAFVIPKINDEFFFTVYLNYSVEEIANTILHESLHLLFSDKDVFFKNLRKAMRTADIPTIKAVGKMIENQKEEWLVNKITDDILKNKNSENIEFEKKELEENEDLFEKAEKLENDSDYENWNKTENDSDYENWEKLGYKSREQMKKVIYLVLKDVGKEPRNMDEAII